MDNADFFSAGEFFVLQEIQNFLAIELGYQKVKQGHPIIDQLPNNIAGISKDSSS